MRSGDSGHGKENPGQVGASAVSDFLLDMEGRDEKQDGVHTGYEASMDWWREGNSCWSCVLDNMGLRLDLHRLINKPRNTSSSQLFEQSKPLALRSAGKSAVYLFLSIRSGKRTTLLRVSGSNLR